MHPGTSTSTYTSRMLIALSCSAGGALLGPRPLLPTAMRVLMRKDEGGRTVTGLLGSIAPGLASTVLWQLVKKGKVHYDPGFWNSEKFLLRDRAGFQTRMCVRGVLGRGGGLGWGGGW